MNKKTNIDLLYSHTFRKVVVGVDGAKAKCGLDLDDPLKLAETLGEFSGDAILEVFDTGRIEALSLDDQARIFSLLAVAIKASMVLFEAGRCQFDGRGSVADSKVH